MNKVLRVLLLTVVVLTMVVPLTVSADAHGPATLSIPGRIFNGTNGGPESPVTVRLWRDTGGGDVMIREETFEGKRKWDVSDPWNPVPADEEWNNTFSAMGDFFFQVNCVQGYYTIQIDAFMEGGADAVGVRWYEDRPGGGQNLLKKEAGDSGPWTFSWYVTPCKGNMTLLPTVFEYSSVAGPRANAGWMYVAGKVLGVYTLNGQPVAIPAVQNATLNVSRHFYDEDMNWSVFALVDFARTAVTGPKGFWGVGLTRQPGMYSVQVTGAPTFCRTIAGHTRCWAYSGAVSANPLWFQVFDVYGSGGADDAYGPGSAWLPWNFMQADWIYNNLNFLITYQEMTNND